MLSICYVTTPTMEMAKSIAGSLVRSKAAACVSIVPRVTSVYVWDGELKDDEEYLLMIKTQTALVSDVVALVKREHTFDVPEVISVPIQEGNKDYLDWVKSATSPAS